MGRHRRVRSTPAPIFIVCPLSVIGAIALACSAAGAIQASATPGSTSSAGTLAYSCGAPSTPSPDTAGGRGQLPIFPSGQFPVTLPAASLLGARNDLPNPG